MLYPQPGDDEVLDAVERVAKTRGVSAAQISLAWLLRQPAVTAPIVGATKLVHLDDAIAAVDLALTDEEAKSLESPYRPHAIRGH
jgi:aryl-alcohol dehydrogenase-like predicted oxidoreductase